MTQEQTHSEAPQADTPEDGSLDAAALAFEKRETAEDQQPDAQSDESETTEADPNTEADEGEPEEDTEPEFVDLEYEGVTIRVQADKAEEAKKALLRQSDYSRKMNEVSAKEKQAQQVIEQAELMRGGAEKLAGALAQIQMIDARIKEFESLDWQKLRAEDPANYAAYAADFQTLKLNRQQAEMQARGVAQEVEQAQQKTLLAKRAEMFQALPKVIPGWSDQVGQQITEFAVSRGISFETLAKATDANLIAALHDAMKYAALQKGKAEVKAKAQTAPPVLKPGAVKPRSNPQADALAKLRKSNTLDDAAAAFLSRMK